MAALSTSSEYFDLTVQEMSHNYEQIKYMADNDKNVLSERGSGLEEAMAGLSTSSEYCDLTVQETSHNYEQIKYMADNDKNVLSERGSGLEEAMTALPTSSEYCDLTVQETLHNYEQFQYLAENSQRFPPEGVSVRRCLTIRHRLNMLFVVTLFLGVAFIVLIAVFVTSKHSGPSKCSSQPCKHGKCVDDIDNYRCECYAGFNGLQCELEIDECYSSPCQHGRCLNEINKYTCICERGYNGTNCEENVDECTSNTCIHGVCQDGIDGYNCTCFKGYTGLKCELEIDFCSPNPCIHGICSDGTKAYQCECFAGFQGTNCNQESLASKNFWIGPVITDTKTIYVNYSLVSGQDTLSDLRTCAEEFTNNQYLAVRVSEGTGKCEGLDWDWGGDPQYVDGFAYLRKTKTVDIYHPSITKLLNWLLPGTFGVGGRVELYISIRHNLDWKKFDIMILDTTGGRFNVYDNEPEVIMAFALIENQKDSASVHFKIWKWAWINKLYLRKTQVGDGNAHKFTFVPQADVMQIFIDDTKVVEYTHPTDPATAKGIIINPFSIPSINLHNITFVGV